MSFGEQFTYDVLKDELVIGEVYVRVYNEQPTFVLEVIFIVLSRSLLKMSNKLSRTRYLNASCIYSSLV